MQPSNVHPETMRKTQAAMFRRVIQHIEIAQSTTHAKEMLQGCALQDGFIAGRVLPAANGEPDRMQAFYADDMASGWLPDGLSRRVCPESLLRHCEVLA